MNDERNLGEKTDDSGQQPRYEHYQFHEEQGTVLKPSGPSGHRRNQNSFQKKAGTTIALAVIFGLVAAVVFQAANFAADRFLNTGKSSVQIKLQTVWIFRKRHQMTALPIRCCLTLRMEQ